MQTQKKTKKSGKGKNLRRAEKKLEILKARGSRPRRIKRLADKVNNLEDALLP